MPGGYGGQQRSWGSAPRETEVVVDLMDAVPRLLRHAAEEIVLPVFRTAAAAPEEKAAGEWVTTADRAAEEWLAPRLAALVPGSVVVGEEAVSTDPALLDHLLGTADVWLLDPLDGTANFAAGEEPFAVMAALVRGGEAVAAWVLDPVSGRLVAAERGAGTWVDGSRVLAPELRTPLGAMRGAVLRRFLPPYLREHVDSEESRFAELAPGSRCAGHVYPAVVLGDLDFALFWRTLPWDHVPGALLVTEAGGRVARLDGTHYAPAEHARTGLLVARRSDAWQQIRSDLLPPSPELATGGAEG
jgi:fructose-1,6-bisphosphatase/inositol monophosphatase family enzyme